MLVCYIMGAQKVSARTASGSVFDSVTPATDVAAHRVVSEKDARARASLRLNSENIDIELPYCAAQILLDGADVPFFGLIQECPWEDVRMGMRVEAVWKPESEWQPTAENLRHFKPSGEPDVPFEQFKEHL